MIIMQFALLFSKPYLKIGLKMPFDLLVWRLRCLSIMTPLIVSMFKVIGFLAVIAGIEYWFDRRGLEKKPKRKKMSLVLRRKIINKV